MALCVDGRENDQPMVESVMPPAELPANIPDSIEQYIRGYASLPPPLLRLNR